MDELANWERSLEGRDWSPHWLTFLTMRGALAADDTSVWLLRLPSLLGWIAASAHVAVLAWRMGGIRPAIAAAWCLLVSPIAAFHAQDANHYHFVALATTTSAHALLLAPFRRRHAVASLALLGASFVCGFAHPFAFLPPAIAAPMVTVCLLLPSRRRPGALALWGAPAVGILVAVAAAMQGGGRVGVGVSEGDFMWTVSYLSRLITDLAGTHRIHSLLGAVLGFIAMLGALAGIGSAAARRPRNRPLAGFAIGLAIAHAVLLGVFVFNHYVYSRYFIAVVPLIAVGVGVGMAMSAKRWLRGVAWVGLIAVSVSGAIFMARTHGASFMPYRSALAAAAERSDDDTILVTYRVYNSRAVSFAIRHLGIGEGRIRHRPLEFDFGDPMLFARQVLAVAERADGEPYDVLLLDYADGEQLNPAYAELLASVTESLATFDSNLPDDLTPVRRSLRLSRVDVSALRSRLAIPGGGAVVLHLERRDPGATRALSEGARSVVLAEGDALTMRIHRGADADVVIGFAGEFAADALIVASDPETGPFRTWRPSPGDRRAGTKLIHIPPLADADSAFRDIQFTFLRNGGEPLVAAWASNASDDLRAMGGTPVAITQLLRKTVIPIETLLATPVGDALSLKADALEPGGSALLAVRVLPRGLPGCGVSISVRCGNRILPVGEVSGLAAYRTVPVWRFIEAPGRIDSARLAITHKTTIVARHGAFELGPVLAVGNEPTQ